MWFFRYYIMKCLTFAKLKFSKLANQCFPNSQCMMLQNSFKVHSKSMDFNIINKPEVHWYGFRSTLQPNFKKLLLEKFVCTTTTSNENIHNHVRE